MASALAVALVFATAQDPSPADLYKKTLPSVMTLTADLPEGQSTGTAFLSIRDGVAVTAWHVVRGAKRVTARFSNGEEFAVSGLVDKDEQRDLALIRVKVADRPLLSLNSSDPEVGGKAYVIGAPQGLEFSVSDGLIGQVRQFDGYKQYQFTCPASPGNSGGPLLDPKGQVLGVVSWQVKDGQNLNFAVPSTYVKGLDASLPTTPWADVKIEIAPKTAREAGKTFDAAKYQAGLENAFWILTTGSVAYLYTFDTVINVRNGVDKGVPTEVFVVQEELDEQIRAFKTLGAKDENSAAVIEALTRDMIKLWEVLETLKRAILVAQKTRRWDGASDVLAKEAIAAYSVFRKTNSAEVSALLNDPKYFKGLPVGLQHALVPEQGEFRLGMYGWPKAPLRIAKVQPKQFGDNLGFRIDDVILSVENQSIQSLEDLKVKIKEKLGGKLRVRIRRDRKERDLDLKIPNEIPAGARVPNGG